MALNALLHRHQLSLMRSDAAHCEEVRSAQLELASGYARQIRDLRAETGGVRVEALRVT